jgi:hypothetical protein
MPVHGDLLFLCSFPLNVFILHAFCIRVEGIHHRGWFIEGWGDGFALQRMGGLLESLPLSSHSFRALCGI